MADITTEKDSYTAKDIAEFIELGVTTLRDVKGISDDEMDAAYTVAYNHYSVGRYEDAESIFNFLILLDHLNEEYWMGLGASCQAQKKFKEALSAYQNVVGNLNVENYKAAYYAAECLLGLGDKENAAKALDTVKIYADVKTEEGREFAVKANKLKALV